MPDFNTVCRALAEHLGNDNDRKRAFKQVLGDSFLKSGLKASYWNGRFWKEVETATGHKLLFNVSKMLSNFKNNCAGDDLHAYALYYTARNDAQFSKFLPEIDAALFGGHQNFESIFDQGNESPTDKSRTPQPRLSSPRLSAGLLHYTDRAIDVLGREQEQAALWSFVNAGPGFRWLQLAGAGGQGKSRLAYELILEFRGQWETGILRKADLEVFRPHWSDWKPTKPHLIIIDYIIGSEAQVGDAMRALASRSADLVVPVCLLLVERQRWDRGGLQSDPDEDRLDSVFSIPAQAEWFVRLNASVEGDDLSHPAYRFGDGVIELNSLSPYHLVRIVRQMADLRGAVLTKNDEEIAAEIARIDQTGRPLYAYFLGHALAETSYRAGDKSSLLRFVLERDQVKRWSHAFDGKPPSLADDHPALRLALLATMIGSLDCRRLSEVQGWQPPDAAVRQQAHVLNDGPSEGGVLGPAQHIGALEPDLLGEWFVLTAFARGGFLVPLVETAWRLAPMAMASFVSRIVQDFAAHPSTGKILEQALPTTEGANAISGICATIVHYLAQADQPIPAQVMSALHVAAEGGNAKAMVNLGYCYSTGKGVTLDWSKAVEWYHASADSGNALAMANLGGCYSVGHGVPRDYSTAIQWYETAYENGYPEAAYYIGLLYSQDEWPQRDDAKAAKWYIRGAKAGDLRAIGKAALYLYLGVEVPADYYQAFQWLQHAADMGDIQSMVNLGIYYSEGRATEQDYHQALHWYMKAADAGDPSAMTFVAISYAEGNGVLIDPGKAFEWCQRSADLGYEPAMANLGYYYAQGIGVERNYTEAMNWYLRAKDFPLAMANIGYCYAHGLGVEQDYLRSLEWYEKGAEAGDVLSMVRIGLIYAEGLGVERNFDAAAPWYGKAVELDCDDDLCNEEIAKLQSLLMAKSAEDTCN